MDIYDLLGKIDHTEDQDKVSYSAGAVSYTHLDVYKRQ